MFNRSLLLSGIILSLFSLLSLSACNTVKPYYAKQEKEWQTRPLPESEPDHVVYLIGDAGDLQAEDPIGTILTTQLATHPDGASSLIFLGDNIYHYGLPLPDAPDRKEKEEIIENQMKLADGYSGNTFFIPGNHDWNKSKEGGLSAIRREENYVEAHFGGQNVFRPDNGCPGPVELQLTDSLVLVIIDSEWWLHKYETGLGIKDGCSVDSREQFVEQLYAALESNSEREVLLVAHHPVVTNGVHGGHFGFLDHLFPLRNVRNYLYVPLPVIGSIYPVARMSGVSRQDTPNKVFKSYKAIIDTAFTKHPRLIYASGHEHNLQMIEKDNIRQIISGAGSKLNYAASGHKANFVHQNRGYSRMLYYASSEIWVEFVAVDPENGEGRVVYRKQIF
ncbi:hypothetical protein [Fulvivirga sedimenti]|uniref:Calcineurin-like phosphoesterase domain-containing protein n=1 Tax=Fulvivirga sedimenti TaxID=2879465 RepID=A0A9X1HUB7_9BACT|nr:hypothetical protein [Fulvivirga sedimenti]MCA6074863.1 hypothetical protein [Fulvivirga sedimenti]MCA6076040.1 hypothetical protein [Fulvivirga sedimenti]MCA6077168.1 hypothetical protein [Fulvivirga sedimenti]